MLEGPKFGSKRIIALYDQSCPFCRMEMHRIKQWDKNNKIALVDISAIDFQAEAWGFPLTDLTMALHVYFPDIGWLKGMPAIRKLYREVNHGWLILWTGLPGLSKVFDKLYANFACNRVAMSRLLGYSSTRICQNERCVKFIE